MSTEVPGPLDGLRVIDCSRGTAGPRMTGMLADYGAEVLWVEPPGGDPWRERLQVPYSVFNRNKRSIEIDLRHRRGRATLLDLCRTADVFAQSWHPGVAEGLGLGYEELHEALPELVYCSISGFGTEGPYRDLPGYEALVHAVSGLMGAQSGHRAGPIFIGLPLATAGAAYMALIGILAALYRRESDGWGRHVETSLLDGVIAYLSQAWGYSERPQGAVVGSARFLSRPGGAAGYECSDGEYLGVSTFGRGAFDRLMTVLGVDDRIPPAGPAVDASTPLSPEELEVMRSEIPRIFALETREVWIDRLLAADIAAIPVLHQGQVFDEPQPAHNEMVLELEDPVLGRVQQVAPPIRFDGTLRSVERPAPTCGQHTAEILDELRAGRRDRPPRERRSRDERPLLDGVTVLDLGHWYAGPYSARLLADLGADVIKIEPPSGDGMRGFERAFSAAQSGKRAIAVDLKDPELGRLRAQLIERADIVLHNLRVGVAERLGIGYDHVRSRNPDAIYLHAPGWGSSGPDVLRQAFAPLMSGYVGASYEVSGRGNPPVGPVANEDSGAGMLGAVSLLMALWHRTQTGQGQYLELPQLNSAMSDMKHVVRRSDGLLLGAETLDGDQTGTGPLHRLYRTGDGWLCLVVTSDAEFAALDRGLGGELLKDGRFATSASRSRHAAELAALLSHRFSIRATDDLLSQLRDAGVAVVQPNVDNNVPTMDDPVNLQLGRVGEFVHPRLGKVREPGVMVRVDGTHLPPHRRAPELGEHTEEVLVWAGYRRDEIAALRSHGAIR